MNNYPILIGIVVLFICVGFSGCNELVGIDLSGITVHSWKIERYDDTWGSEVRPCLAVNVTVDRQNGAYFFLVLPNGTRYAFPELVREKETTTINLPLGPSSTKTFSAGTYTIVAYDTDYMYKKSPDPIFTKKISFNGVTLSFLDWTVDQWGFYSYPDHPGYYIQDLTLKINNIGDLPVRPTIKVQTIGKTDEIEIDDYILPNREINLTVHPQIYEIPSGTHAAVIEIHYDDKQCILNKNFITYQPRLSVSGFSTKWRYWEGSNDYSLYTVSMNIRNDGSLPFYFGKSEISVGGITGTITSINPNLIEPHKDVQIISDVTDIKRVSSGSKTIDIGIKDTAGNLAENYQSVSSPQEYIQFSLNSWDVLTIDNHPYGYNIDLKLDYTTNENAYVHLLDPSGNGVKRQPEWYSSEIFEPIYLISSTCSIPLGTGDYVYDTPRGGQYTLQVGEYVTNINGSSTFRVAQRKYITLSDPIFSANNFVPQWHQVYDDYQLTSFTLQIKNDGDLPAFIGGYVITIDGKDFSYDQFPNVALPQGQQTITCNEGGAGPAWFAAGMHTITIRFSTENYGNGDFVGSYNTSVTIP